jgi:hypothetical protein
MEMQMDKLRESKLNMQMLQSMKHKNIALQNIGLKVSDADDIMLDLAEAQSDAQDVQNSLESSFTHDEDISHLDLEEELQLMLSDEALLPMAPRHKAPTSIQAAQTHDDELRMQTVTESRSKPPDEPPGATEAKAGSAVLEVVYTDAVTPISTMHPTKSAKTMHKTKARRQQQVSTAEPDNTQRPRRVSRCRTTVSQISKRNNLKARTVHMNK